MSDNLVIGGATFTGVMGIKATDTQSNVVAFLNEKGYKLELIASTTKQLEEYTSTTAENVDTGIQIKNNANANYAFIIVVVTCGSAITTSTEWGMSVCLCGRYTNGNIETGATACMQTKGTSSLLFSAQSSNSVSNSYGIYVNTNYGSVSLVRKCHATSMPKIRGGTYTITAYGLTYKT